MYENGREKGLDYSESDRKNYYWLEVAILREVTMIDVRNHIKNLFYSMLTYCSAE